MEPTISLKQLGTILVEQGVEYFPKIIERNLAVSLLATQFLAVITAKELENSNGEYTAQPFLESLRLVMSSFNRYLSVEDPGFKLRMDSFMKAIEAQIAA